MAETFESIQAEIDAAEGIGQVDPQQLMRYVKALTAGGGLELPTTGLSNPYQQIIPGTAWTPVYCWSRASAHDGLSPTVVQGTSGRLTVEAGGGGFWTGAWSLGMSTTALVEFALRHMRGSTATILATGRCAPAEASASGLFGAQSQQWQTGDYVQLVARAAASTTISIYSADLWLRRDRAES